MNKIVREHYPVEKLPEDLRQGIRAGSAVTVQITEESEVDSEVPEPLSSEDAVALMRQMQRENAQRGRGITEQEAVDRIRAVRDEWED